MSKKKQTVDNTAALIDLEYKLDTTLIGTLFNIVVLNFDAQAW